MGLSRNKVAVPEGAAGTPPFWKNGKRFTAGARPSASEGQGLLAGTPPFWKVPFYWFCDDWFGAQLLSTVLYVKVPHRRSAVGSALRHELKFDH